MPFWEDDLDILFNLNEFGQAAVIGTGPDQKTITVIFDKTFIQHDSEGYTEYGTHVPIATCKTSDVDTFTKNDPFITGGISYSIRDVHHEEGGISRLVLYKD